MLLGKRVRPLSFELTFILNRIEVVQHTKKSAESKTSGKVADDRDEESECRPTKQ